jgi:hypothetical protein
MSVWHVVVMLIALVLTVGLWVSAIVSILRQQNMRPMFKILWAILCFVVPILGPLAWFIGGR